MITPLAQLTYIFKSRFLPRLRNTVPTESQDLTPLQIARLGESTFTELETHFTRCAICLEGKTCDEGARLEQQPYHLAEQYTRVQQSRLRGLPFSSPLKAIYASIVELEDQITVPAGYTSPVEMARQDKMDALLQALISQVRQLHEKRGGEV
jgi:hypothetical protein